MFDELDEDPKPFVRFPSKPARRRDTPSFWLKMLLGTVTLAGLGVIGLVVMARAHEAPTGWSFDASCCSNRDCGEVPADWISEGPDGITVIPTGEKLSYGDIRIKDSPDGITYWCSPPGIEPHTICVYLPPKGF